MANINDYFRFALWQEGFKVSDEAENTGDSTITYFGYLNREGHYYIMEANDTNGTYRFVTGTSGYATAWAARQTLSYDYFDTTFK